MNLLYFHKNISKYLSSIIYIFLITIVLCIIWSLSIFNNSNYGWNIYPRYQIFSSDPNVDSNPISIYKRILNERSNQTIATKAIQTQESEKKFRIKTNGCKISEIPVFDDETRRLFENKTETKWKCKPTTVKVERVKHTSIQFNYSDLKYKLFCYYRDLNRGKDDFTFNYGKFNGPIVKDILDLPDYNFVHVLCYKNKPKVDLNKSKTYNKKDPDLIHNQIIPLIPVINKTSDSSVPNVLLLAIDSTSYVNFKRHFIRTEKLIKKYKMFELKGYNKVGANTFPNMIPFLTGHHSRELVSDKEVMNVRFDDWPIIWKKYSQKGFVTAFVEEWPKYGLFQYKRKGFSSKPTDYETRPFHMEIMSDKYNKFCYRDRTETEHSLDFTIDFIKAMKERNQKFFAYISICDMTHDWLNGGHYMDVPYYKLFSRLFEDKLVDNTVIIFFSDHGLRIGPIRETHSGEMENRLPFIFIHMPNTTNQMHLDNLDRNQYRLTTHFDIHATLTHLIDGQANHSLPHGLSLLEDVISSQRDCESASIPEMFCSCYEDIPVRDHQSIKPNQTIPKILKKLNSLTDKLRPKCAEYSLESINNVYNRSSSQRPTAFKKLGDVLIVQMFVKPGKALFEVVIRGFDDNTRFEITGDITRISQYGNQSHCIEDKVLRNYCFCNDLLQNQTMSSS